MRERAPSLAAAHPSSPPPAKVPSCSIAAQCHCTQAVLPAPPSPPHPTLPAPPHPAPHRVAGDRPCLLAFPVLLSGLACPAVPPSSPSSLPASLAPPRPAPPRFAGDHPAPLRAQRRRAGRCQAVLCQRAEADGRNAAGAAVQPGPRAVPGAQGGWVGGVGCGGGRGGGGTEDRGRGRRIRPFAFLVCSCEWRGAGGGRCTAFAFGREEGILSLWDLEGGGATWTTSLAVAQGQVRHIGEARQLPVVAWLRYQPGSQPGCPPLGCAQCWWTCMHAFVPAPVAVLHPRRSRAPPTNAALPAFNHQKRNNHHQQLPHRHCPRPRRSWASPTTGAATASWWRPRRGASWAWRWGPTGCSTLQSTGRRNSRNSWGSSGSRQELAGGLVARVDKRCDSRCSSQPASQPNDRLVRIRGGPNGLLDLDKYGATQ